MPRQASTVQRSYDIFCKVIDNYGDIGVCWRLARRLAARADSGSIRLLVDDLASFARIAPTVDTHADTQRIDGILVQHWPANADHLEPSSTDVVIEAFGCSPPTAYIQGMTGRQLWINLEYLSAEDWVESCHALPSMQVNGLRKFFFFPGFTQGTGGLLREPGLLARRQAWQSDPRNRMQLLADLNIRSDWLSRLQNGARLVYVYCYPEAPLPALIQALSTTGRDTLLLLPEGIWPGGVPAPAITHTSRVEALTHPFVDQERFDALLWSSDLNVVRGEDSLVRAIWAARPMIWQPYLQADNTHLEKLNAWLSRTPYPAQIRQALMAWNLGDSDRAQQALTPLLQSASLREWGALTHAWCEQLARQNDLADQLADFCTEQGQTS